MVRIFNGSQLFSFGHLEDCFKISTPSQLPKSMSSYEITFMEIKYKLKPGYLFNAYPNRLKIVKDIVCERSCNSERFM